MFTVREKLSVMTDIPSDICIFTTYTPSVPRALGLKVKVGFVKLKIDGVAGTIETRDITGVCQESASKADRE